jgi:hypothetical protein
MSELFDSIAATVKSGIGMRKAGERAQDARRDYWERFQAADFEPEYLSDHAPEFKKANSPVARAYLESFLTGSNPDAIQGTRLGADGERAAAAQRFDRDYGGMDKLVRDSAREQADNSRFEVTPIDRPVVSPEANILAEREKRMGKGRG